VNSSQSDHPLPNEEMFVKIALNSWNTWQSRADKLFDSLTDEQMQTEIAPGKNRAIYVLGHLIAVNDSMFPQLGIGEAKYAPLRETFVSKPDRSVAELPAIAELRQSWKELSTRTSASLSQLTPAQWLEKHALVSEEDFAKEPHRNRFAILHSRTAHLAYHIGQLIFLTK
jgi:hypothetical protein